jgi:Putative restriction endonuclease
VIATAGLVLGAAFGSLISPLLAFPFCRSASRGEKLPWDQVLRMGKAVFGSGVRSHPLSTGDERGPPPFLAGSQEEMSILRLLRENIMVLSSKPIMAYSSFTSPSEPSEPICVLEFASQSGKRKDYDDIFDKCEIKKVPYYLIFHAEQQELTKYRHDGDKYISTKPIKHGSFAIPELNLEVGLLGGELRFWYEGRLLPLPIGLQENLDD